MGPQLHPPHSTSCRPTPTPAPVPQVGQYYKWLLDVEVMIFVGFGFLMTFLRRYGYSAVTFNFFTSALIMLEAVLLIGAVQQVGWWARWARVPGWRRGTSRSGGCHPPSGWDG